MQREDDALAVAIHLFPPADVGDPFVGVGVGQVLEVVIRHRDSQSVVLRVLRQAARHRPRPQDAVLFQTQVEVVPRFVMLVQHKRRPSLLIHSSSLPLCGRSDHDDAGVATPG